jgi:hypothetical protein
MDNDKAVPLTIVPNEVDAEMLCGLLRAGGIQCGHRVTEQTDSAFDGLAFDGPREILVHQDDLSAARALLPDPE